MTAPTAVSVAAVTNQGLRRSHNEDTIVVGGWRGNASMTKPYVLVQKLEQPLLCLVADGMGGHAAGEEASRIAAQHITEHILEADGESKHPRMHTQCEPGHLSSHGAIPRTARDGHESRWHGPSLERTHSFQHR